MASSSSSRPPSLISSSPTSSDSLSPLSTPTEPNAFPILPKLALNTQIESTLSPWLRWQIALRNGIPLPRKYKNYTSLLRTYAFDPAKSRDETKDVSNTDDVYCGSSSLFAPCRYRGVEVLRLAADFYDLAMCYFEACNSQNVRYTELFFNVHAHVRRGVPISTVMAGFSRAKADAERRFGIRSLWILCFSGHISPECAIELYNDCRPWNHMLIAGVGVDAHDTWVSPHQRSQHADSLQDKLHRPSVVFASLFISVSPDKMASKSPRIVQTSMPGNEQCLNTRGFGKRMK